MNDQPTATQLGLNPFAPDGPSITKTAGRDRHSPYDPRAKGLDGDMLDAMAKGRWQEGHDVGYVDGHRVATASYEEIYNEGFATGRMHGETGATARLASQLLPVLEHCGGAFATIAGKTGSKETEDVCAAMIPRIRDVLDRHIGEHATAAQAARAMAQATP